MTSKNEDLALEDIITAQEPSDETPAIVPVADGVMGTGTVSKKTTKKAPVKKEKIIEKVALFSSRNLVWQEVGKIVKGYNFVTPEAAEKWLTKDSVRLAEPSEIRANLG